MGPRSKQFNKYKLIPATKLTIMKIIIMMVDNDETCSKS